MYIKVVASLGWREAMTGNTSEPVVYGNPESDIQVLSITLYGLEPLWHYFCMVLIHQTLLCKPWTYIHLGKVL